MAEVFARHNLGEAKLLPLDLYDRKRTVKFDQQLFALIPGNDRRTIDTEVTCKAIRPIRYTDPQRYMLGSLEYDYSEIATFDQPDDDIACWMDSQVSGTLFFDEALVKDLTAAGFADRFVLQKFI